jgi:small-conductance mechanosensitive channel
MSNELVVNVGTPAPAESPKSVSYDPEATCSAHPTHASYFLPLSVCVVCILLLSPAIIIMCACLPAEYFGTGHFNNIFFASVSFCAAFLIFFGINKLLRVLPNLVTWIFQSDAKYITENSDHTLMIYFYLSLSVAATTLFFLSQTLFIQFDPAVTSHTWEFFYLKLVDFTSRMLWLLFVEKLVTQKIAIYFHKQFYAERLEENEFLMRCIERLKILFLGPRAASTTLSQSSTEEDDYERDSKKLVDAIFTGLSVPEDRNYLESKDLASAFHEDAQRFFDLMDLDHNGDLGRQEFEAGIVRVHTDSQILVTSIASNNRVVIRLEYIMYVLIAVYLFYTGLSMLTTQVWNQVSLLGASIIAARFLFAEEVSAMFTGIIFVIVTHPFDIGDSVSIGSSNFTIVDVDLTITTLKGPGGRTTYISNSSLADEKIGNMRRSGNMFERYKLSIEGRTTKPQIEQFEQVTNDFVHENSRDFEGDVMLKNFSIINKDSIQFELDVKHRSNFQDMSLRNRRNKGFVEALRGALATCQMQLAEFNWESLKHD